MTTGRPGRPRGPAGGQAGVVFFTALEESVAGGATPMHAYGDALTSILPWQVACYVAAAGLMLLLPRAAETIAEA